MAIAKSRKEGKNFSSSNSIEFSVVDISDTMGWDSGPVKKELKLLMIIFNEEAHLTFKSIFHKALHLFKFDWEITFESVPETNQY